MIRKFRIASIFIALFLILTLATGAFAAAKLILKAKEGDLIGTNFSLTLYLGSGTTALTAATAVRNTAESNANQWVYDINTFGAYNYQTTSIPNTSSATLSATAGSPYYNVTKLIYITPEQVTNNEVIEMTLPGKKAADHDFRIITPSYTGTTSRFIVPSDQQMASQYLGAVEGVNKYYPTVGFISPRFVKPGYAEFQFTTYYDLEKFVEEQVARNPKARMFYLADLIDDSTGQPFGGTPRYGYRIPIVTLTNSFVPPNATFEEAAAIIRSNGKPTLFHQAQIHGNESAPAEGAMLMLAEMVGEYGEKYLEKVNFISMPRFNVEGGHENHRSSRVPQVDMNRDHLRMKAQEVRMVHKAYLLTMPEVINDSHELTPYAVTTNASSTTRQAGTTTGSGIAIGNQDLQSCPATSLNNPSQEVNNYAFDVFAYNIFTRLQDDGIAIGYYGETHNNGIGRAYFGLMGSVSILVEVRGQNAGVNIKRRAYSQLAAAKVMLDTLYEDAENIRDMILRGRANVIQLGSTYDPDVRAHLTMTSTKPSLYRGDTRVVDLLGNNVARTVVTSTENAATGSSRYRSRPTAYVIPKGITGTPIADGSYTVNATNQYSINYEWLLNSMKWNGIEFYEIAPGSAVNLKQYYRSDTSNSTSGSIQAGLRSETEVTLPSGAYVVPLDQVTGAVALTLFEPDMAGANSYNASVAQSLGDSEALALITHNTTTRDYPYYRLEATGPREVLPMPYIEVKVFPTADGINVVVMENYGNGDLKEVLIDETFIQPTKEGYTFKDWSIDYSNGKLTVEPLFEINKYTVTFVNWDGAVLSEQIIEHGSGAVAPANPQRIGHTFTGWSVGFSNITGNLTVTALFEINKYTVIFMNEGVVFNSQTVNYGSAATDPGVPVKLNYTFTGWNVDYSNITGDLTVTALYKANLKSAIPTAFVDKIPGNKNGLTVTVTETYYDGVTITFTETFSIDNNAAGTYKVGVYKVYVDTKGNTQIRECYIVN